MTRLKRWFERVNKADMGAVLIVDTPETSRDLLVFVERFSLEVTALDLEVMHARAEAHKLRETQAAKIMSGSYTSPGVTALAVPAREYQQVASDLANATRQLLLGDDLGLGKTISAIATLAQNGEWPALVVTLTHLPKQWQRELAKFCPGLTTHILEKGTPYDLTAKRKRKKTAAVNEAETMPDVIITNYHKLAGWAETLADLPIKAVVFDEVQELRRGESKRGEPTLKYAAAEHIARAADLRLGLSATPVYNYGSEIFYVLNALAPDALGTSAEFKREFCYSYGEKWLLKDPKAFGTYLRAEGLMLRRTRGEVGRELPALSIFPHQVETDRKQFSGSDLTELARIIVADTEESQGQKWQAAGKLDYQLRRQTGLAKADFVAAFVRMLVESGESVVLYAWHHECYDRWRHALKDLDPAFYTGKESPTKKEAEINRFKDGQTKVAILSLRSGAGLDGLQHVCRTVVFGELDWSPGVMEQCVGRVYRDGQAEPVVVYFLVADSGSDPIIFDTLNLKRMQSLGLRDPDAPLVEEGVDPAHMRKLAESFLRQRGELPPADDSPETFLRGTEELAQPTPYTSGGADVTPAESAPPVEVPAPTAITTEPTQLGLFEEETTAA